MKRSTGAWVVYSYDYGTVHKAVYDDELEARRGAETWEEVIFVPWGVDIAEHIAQSKRPEPKPTRPNPTVGMVKGA